MLSANNPTPLYKQLSHQLQAKIEEGTFQAGEKLPSLRELAANYGINRLTARKAIELLVHNGFVRVYQGIGVFVESPQNPGDTLSSYRETILSSQEIEVATRTLSVNTILADATLAKQLHIKLEEKVVKVEQVRLSDGVPVALEASWIPYSVCSDVLNGDMECEPLYAISKHARDVNLWRTDQVVQAVLATGREMSLLGLQPPAALLSIHCTTYDTLGRVVEYAQIVYPEDRFHIDIPPQQRQ